jgi:hypothetical protein
MSNSESKPQQLYVFFIRPKPRFNYEDMPVFLVSAFNEESAWEYIFKDTPITKEEYYVDDILISPSCHPLGLIWPSRPTI